MKLHSDPRSGQHHVTGYGAGWVAINGRRYERSLLLLPDRIVADWGPESPEALTEAHLASLAALTGFFVIHQQKGGDCPGKHEEHLEEEAKPVEADHVAEDGNRLARLTKVDRRGSTCRADGGLSTCPKSSSRP